MDFSADDAACTDFPALASAMLAANPAAFFPALDLSALQQAPSAPQIKLDDFINMDNVDDESADSGAAPTCVPDAALHAPCTTAGPDASCALAQPGSDAALLTLGSAPDLSSAAASS